MKALNPFIRGLSSTKWTTPVRPVGGFFVKARREKRCEMNGWIGGRRVLVNILKLAGGVGEYKGAYTDSYTSV